jgi:hypothetical protein
MHKRDALVAILIAAVVLALSASCVDELSGSSDATIRYSMIQIDSIQAPDTISQDDSLALRFWGAVGPSGCYSFVHFDHSWQHSLLVMTVRGKHTTGKPCHHGFVSLWGEPFVIESRRGKLGILVHQPDGSELRDSVIVK